NEARLDAELAAGRAADLVGELEALVRAEPLRERPYGQLMLALYRSGRQAEALEAYHDARSKLVEELGLEPTEELQALYRRILNQDRTLIVDAVPHERVPDLPRPLSSFVGREREVQELLGLLLDDDVRLLTLTGPGGTGKTRLALRAAEEAAVAYPDGAYWV